MEIVQVFGKRALIKRIKETQTKSGLALPDTMRETNYALTGTVVMLGDQVEDKSLLKKPVYVNRYPQSANWLDQDRLIVNYEDIIGLAEL